MADIPHPLDIFWDDILSGNPRRVRAAFADLDRPTAQAVLLHLRRMIKEPGWQPAQRAAARVALEILESA